MGLYPLDNPVEVAIAVWPWGAYLGEEALEPGVSCKVSSFRRIGPNTLPPAAKASGQYINSVLAKLEASRAGYDEAILLNEEGYVADGSGENVFVVRDGVLYTPPTTASCLPGITRDSVIRMATVLGIEVREVNLVRTDLYFADEVFLCGTAAEVTPVASVDGQPTGGRGPVTKASPGHLLRHRQRAATSGSPTCWSTRSGRPPSDRRMVTTRRIPLARPLIGEREEELVLDVLRSGALALGAMRAGLRARVRRPRRHAATPSPARAGRRACTSRSTCSASSPGDEVITSPLLVRRLGQRDPAPRRHAGLRRHRRAHVQPGPRRRRGGGHAAHQGHPAGAHLRLPVRDRGDQRDRRANTGSRWSRTPARRWAPRSTAARWARTAIRRCSPSIRTSR